MPFRPWLSVCAARFIGGNGLGLSGNVSGAGTASYELRLTRLGRCRGPGTTMPILERPHNFASDSSIVNRNAPSVVVKRTVLTAPRGGVRTRRPYLTAAG